MNYLLLIYKGFRIIYLPSSDIAATRKVLVRSLKEQILNLVNQHGLTNVILEHKLSGTFAR